MDTRRTALWARVAPRVLLGATAALVVLGSWLMVILATRMPGLGVRFTVPERGPGLVIAEVHPTSPAAGVVQPGVRVVAIGPKDGPRRELSAESLVEDPDFLPTYAARRAFFEEQGRLCEALGAADVVLYLDGGGEAVVQPRHRRSEGWLPAVFWFQLACGAIGLLTGAAVFALRGGSTAARLYGFNGLSFAVITFTAAVYSTRELALGATTFRWLAAIDHLGAMGFAVGFIALIWHYPRPLGGAPVFRMLAVVLGAVWVLDTTSLLPAPTWGIQAPMIAGLVLSCGLGVLQWRRSARDPLGRAGVRWFSLSVFLGGSCFVVSIFVSVWLGRAPAISQGYAFGFVLTMYLGVAFGVARYRLFDLERWWVSLWLWVLAGACVVVADLAFARALGVSQSTAAGLALLVIGWLYFPARQWLLARLTQRRDVELLQLFPRTVKVVLESRTEEELARDWRSLLRELFDPLEVTDAGVAVPAATIAEDGMALLVPSVTSQPPTRLRLARRGHRLFTSRERETVQSLVDLLEHVLRQRDAYELGVHAERKRIARDLHDDIGSRLLTLVHRSTDGPVADLARDTLRELRTVVSTLGSGPAPLAEALADWRSETAERCDAAGVELGWTQSEHVEGIQLDAPTRTNIVRVLREALSNALRHARPTRVDVEVRLDGCVLSLTMSDDGSAPPPSSWPRGRGLANIEQRIAELGGRSELRQRTTTGTELVLRVPLPEGAKR